MKTPTVYPAPPSSLSSSVHSSKPINPSQLANFEQQPLPPWKSHSVNRTKELLSCARTAFKIAQQKRRQFQQSQQQRQQTNGHSSWKKSKEEGDLIPEWMLELDPNDLTLYVPPPPSFSQLDENDGSGHGNSNSNSNSSSTRQLMKDAQTLLAILDSHLTDLHSLVRRRGHTNDPTMEIQSLLEKFQSIGIELKEGISSLRSAGTIPVENNSGEKIKSSGQRRRHYELLSDRLENDAKERMDKLKKELETRSQVLRDQNVHRRKLLGNASNHNKPATKSGGLGGAVNLGSSGHGVGRTVSGVGGGSPGIGRVNHIPAKTALGAAASASQQFQSPLFTMTASSSSSAPPSMNGNGTTSSSLDKPPSYTSGTRSGYSGYAGYGGATPSAAGYGGTSTAPSFATGMRQRKQQQTPTRQTQSSLQIDRGHEDDADKDDENKYSKSTTQQQIQIRRQNRETQSRLASARLAEKSIAELGVMFTKMSTLISQQGEVLERIEDEVERAGGDIDAGHDEIVKLYGMTKGNRALILKVFGILIFFIVFMKLY
ncbi:hypothetical protein ACHAXS_007326 [Conticribra weissflogii]